MIDFKPIELDKIEEYSKYYNDKEALGCESSFVSGYIWSMEYKLGAAILDDTIIKAYFRTEQLVWGYCMPHGKNVTRAIEAIFADAAERGQKAVIAYLTKSEREQLEALYPGRFKYVREPENQEYIYNSSDLILLEGKKYHAKRNHISKFYREYGDSVKIEALDENNISDALKVFVDWCGENEIDYRKHGEYQVFKRACDSFKRLGMKGAVLYVGDKPVAMTAGSAVSPACFDVMFEKGLREYDGVYAVINNEFAKTLSDYKYINREEDLGIEGLRKAKLSYHPAIIHDRFSAIPND